MTKQHLEKEEVLEELCALGCRRVNQLLADETLHSQHPELQRLNSTDKQWVLVELQSVMSVYELAGSCSVD